MEAKIPYYINDNNLSVIKRKFFSVLKVTYISSKAAEIIKLLKLKNLNTLKSNLLEIIDFCLFYGKIESKKGVLIFSFKNKLRLELSRKKDGLIEFNYQFFDQKFYFKYNSKGTTYFDLRNGKNRILKTYSEEEILTFKLSQEDEETDYYYYFNSFILHKNITENEVRTLISYHDSQDNIATYFLFPTELWNDFFSHKCTVSDIWENTYATAKFY